VPPRKYRELEILALGISHFLPDGFRRYNFTVMFNAQKWRIAMSRFNGYYAHPPSWPKEKDVEDYHSHVAALEEASGEDLSLFRIPADRLERRVVGGRRAAYGGGPGSTIYAKDKSIDSDYFQAQLDGLKNYLLTIEHRPSSPNYEDLNDYALHELMVNRRIKPPMIIENGQPVYRIPSRDWIIAALRKDDNPPGPSHTTNTYNLHQSNLVQDSPGATATVNVTRGIAKEELRALMNSVTDALRTDRVEARTKEQISVVVDTINLNLNTSAPNPSIIGASLLSLKAMIEGAAGAVLAPTLVNLLPAIATAIHHLKI
jgi:hypothetical protein